MRLKVGLVACCLTLAQCGSASGQYLYLDVTNDGENTSSEVVNQLEANTADIWIWTDRNRDRSTAAAPGRDVARLTINSYEVVLHAEGGTVEWIEYTNLQPTMTVPFGTSKSPTELLVGFGGRKAIPPGRHRLGQVTFRVASGDPRIVIAPRSSTAPFRRTSFGSLDLGINGDHTLKLGVEGSATSGRLNSHEPRIGDWVDVDGLRASGRGGMPGAARADTLSPTAAPASFGVAVVRLGQRATHLRVVTTRPGHLQVRIYNASGRLVSTLIDDGNAAAGPRELEITRDRDQSRALPSGVYFYRLESVEGSLTGRFVVLK